MKPMVMTITPEAVKYRIRCLRENDSTTHPIIEFYNFGILKKKTVRDALMKVKKSGFSYANVEVLFRFTMVTRKSFFGIFSFTSMKEEKQWMSVMEFEI